MNMMITFVGLPGTGKSTLTNKYKGGYVVVSTDQYIEDVAKLDNKTYDQVFSYTIDEATKYINNLIDTSIQNHQNVLIDQTNLSSKKRRGLTQRFTKYHKHCVCILPPTPLDFPEWSKRVNTRPGKTIPAHIIAQMTNNYQMPILEEGWDKISYFDMYGNFQYEIIRNDHHLIYYKHDRTVL